MIWRMTLSGMVRPLLVAAALVVSLAPLQAQDTAAKALVINGDVSVLRDGNPWALFEGNSVRPQQIVKTGPDGYARFQVSDGSTFEVFPNSQVMFRAVQGSLKDLLDVWIGRVKVYIQHLPGIPNFNNVSSPTAVISVRGTVFEVDVEDLDGTTLVSVDEGLVAVRNKVAGGEVYVHPTEQVQVWRNQPLAQKLIDNGSIARKVLDRRWRRRRRAWDYHNRPAGRQVRQELPHHHSGAGAAIGTAATAATATSGPLSRRLAGACPTKHKPVRTSVR